MHSDMYFYQISNELVVGAFIVCSGRNKKWKQDDTYPSTLVPETTLQLKAKSSK